MMNAIILKNIRRIFKRTIGVIKRQVKEVVAVDDISFEIKAGELFGLLGPNGAGKTTLVKMLITTFSTAVLGLLMGCVGLITRNVMLINNTIYFMLLLFSGANLDISTLPKWMQMISNFIPLTRGIALSQIIIEVGK